VLSDPRLCQLAQRISINEKLPPLSRDETRDYIKFRISRAGRADLDISDQVIDVLYQHTRVLPRLINRVMDRSLLMAAASGSTKLGIKDIKKAVSTLPEPGAIQVENPTGKAKAKNGLPAWTGYLAAGSIAAFVTVIILFILVSSGKLSFCPSKSEMPTKKSLTESTNQKSLERILKIEVTAPRARIHSKPLKKSRVLSIVKKGQVFQVIEQKENWYRVEFPGKRGKTVQGWLKKDQGRRLVINSEDKIPSKKTVDSGARR